MNFLAHAVLAGPAPDDRCGGVAGDFVKGLLPGELPAGLAAGVMLHRRIDSFAETHPAFRASRARVSGARRRLAGIMVDLFYDHFLAVHWARFGSGSLEQYVAALYTELDDAAAVLPAGFREILPRMREHNWLLSYRSSAAVADALDRMARYRLRHPNNLTGAGSELLADYAGYEADFLAFFPDAAAFAADWRAQRQAVCSR